MANAIKGEVSFPAAGKTWTLVYDFNALCTIESELAVDVASVGDRLASPSMIRSVFRIGLEARHGAISDIEAGNLIHDMGPDAAADVIARAFKAAFPDASASAEGKAQPRKKKLGTGPER